MDARTTYVVKVMGTVVSVWSDADRATQIAITIRKRHGIMAYVEAE